MENVKEEKDVGVMNSESLRPSTQCAKAAKKADAVLGQLSRGLTYRDKECFVSLYQTYTIEIESDYTDPFGP